MSKGKMFVISGASGVGTGERGALTDGMSGVEVRTGTETGAEETGFGAAGEAAR